MEDKTKNAEERIRRWLNKNFGNKKKINLQFHYMCGNRNQKDCHQNNPSKK
ncbi:hypothetical protein ELI_3144 [Eubacterium callanderi]|uniref:Uncharacterized protein n=1 Tax=Eubacterium callanderi TaxID=53442 RepID=E3GEJ7_9FIRM|nr:hypothetical protein ELI_3144 [Eubacterium callanderi]